MWIYHVRIFHWERWSSHLAHKDWWIIVIKYGHIWLCYWINKNHVPTLISWSLRSFRIFAINIELCCIWSTLSGRLNLIDLLIFWFFKKRIILSGFLFFNFLPNIDIVNVCNRFCCNSRAKFIISSQSNCTTNTIIFGPVIMGVFSWDNEIRWVNWYSTHMLFWAICLHSYLFQKEVKWKN